MRGLRPTRRTLPVFAVLFLGLIAAGVVVKLVHPARSAVERDARHRVNARLARDPGFLRTKNGAVEAVLPGPEIGSGDAEPRVVEARDPQTSVEVRAVRGPQAIVEVVRKYHAAPREGFSGGAFRKDERVPVEERAVVALRKGAAGDWGIRWVRPRRTQVTWARPARPAVGDVEDTGTATSAATLAYNGVRQLFTWGSGETPRSWTRRQAPYYASLGPLLGWVPTLERDEFVTYDFADSVNPTSLMGVEAAISTIEANDPDSSAVKRGDCSTAAVKLTSMRGAAGRVEAAVPVRVRADSPWQVAEVRGTIDVTVSEVSGTADSFSGASCALPSEVDSRVFYRAMLVRSRASADSKWFVARLATRTSADADSAVDVIGAPDPAIEAARFVAANIQPAAWLGVSDSETVGY